MAEFYDYKGYPEGPVTNEWLSYLYLLNPEVLYNIIYGNREPNGLAPHDHAQAGGYPLKRTIASVGFGPSSGSYGILMEAPASVSFATAPKIVGSMLALIPGGLQTIKVKAQVYLGFDPSNPKTVDMACSIMPVTAIGYEYLQGPNLNATATFTSNAGSEAFVDGEFSFTWKDNPVFNEAIDNLVRIIFWLRSDPPAAMDYRLMSASVVHNFTQLPNTEHYRFYAAIGKTILDANEIRAGKPIVSSLTAKLKSIINQLQYALLGATPGLDSQILYTDPRIAFRQSVHLHQHRGRYVVREDGSIFSDGALIPRPLAIEHYGNDNGISAGTMNDRPIKGDMIHSAGSLADATWLTFTLSVPITAGMRSIRVIFELMPKTTKGLSKLFMYSRLVKETEGANSTNTILNRAVAGQAEADETKGSGNYLITEVRPMNNAHGFYTNEYRLEGNTGLWTEAALLPTNGLPAGFNRNHVSRVSEPVDLYFDNPAYNANESRIEPGPYLLSLKFVLYVATVESPAYTVAANANSDSPNLLNVIVLPTPGQ